MEGLSIIGDTLYLAAVVLVLITTLYPLTVWLVAATRSRGAGVEGPGNGSSCASCAVVVAAYNEEEEVLRRLFRALTSLADKPSRIVLAWDGERLGKERLEELGREEVEGKGIIFTLSYSLEPRGKPKALNDALRAVSEDCIIVIDANDLPGSKDYVSLFRRLGCNAVSRWAPMRPRSRLEEALAGIVDYASETLYSRRYAAGLPVLFLGSGSATPRKLATELGGWSEKYMLEDVEYGLRLILSGNRPRYSSRLVTLVELPATFTGFRRQQEKWSWGATQLLRRKIGSIWRSPRLYLWEKLDLTLYLSSYTLSSLWPILVVVASLTPHTRLAGDITGSIILGSLVLNGIGMGQVLGNYRAGVIGRIRLGGGIGAISSTLTPRLLVASLKGLLGVPLRREKTPRTRKSRGIGAVAWELAYSGAVLAATLYSLYAYGFTIAVLVQLLYGLAPVYVAARYHDSL